MDVCRTDPFSELTISYSDTNVLVILLNYFKLLCSTTVFKTTEHRYIVRSIFKRFTPRVCKTLVGFHAMMASDRTGRFHSHPKWSCWNTFLKLTSDTLDAFILLGTSYIKQDTDFPSLESFIVALYCKKKVPLGVKNLSRLRLYVLSENQSESQKMSPMHGALKRFCIQTAQLSNGSQQIYHHRCCLIQNSMAGNGTMKWNCVMLYWKNYQQHQNPSSK